MPQRFRWAGGHVWGGMRPRAHRPPGQFAKVVSRTVQLQARMARDAHPIWMGMSLVFLSLAIAALWINLLGAGLAARRFVADYALARATGVLALCLACFCLEHFVGFGPHPFILPITTLASLWLIWRDRSWVRENRGMEGVFAVGFLYCLVWRYTFPDIDYSEDKMPNFALIETYMSGVRLPPPDLWMSGFRANCYYSFQNYGAALLGRVLGIGPGLSYHLAFCALVGMLTQLCGSCVSRLCSWRPGRWTVILCLLIGGSGVAVVAHALIANPYPVDIVRFIGGAIVHDELTPLGHKVSSMIVTPGVIPRDLPMEPLSYFLSKGDYHPPLSGFLLLAMAAALIAVQETGASGAARRTYHAILAATVPVAFVSNAWIVPLQALLVGGWFLHRVLRGERSCLWPALAGAAAATAFEYPFLLQFTQQAIGDNAAIRVTEAVDHTPILGWLLMFWPVLGILGLGLFNRDRRPLALFFFAVWSIALFSTEYFYNRDLYGGPYARFNSTLKWWQWEYAGIVLTLGSLNLGSKCRLPKYGTLLLLLPTLLFGYDLARQYVGLKKGSLGHMSGSWWLGKDMVMSSVIADLSARPGGVTLESGLIMANSESPAITLFSDKQSLLGWPWLEFAWRGSLIEVDQRLEQMNAFYSATLPDPMGWLLHNDVRYVLWLPRDNIDNNSRFRTISDRIRARYFWHHVYGNDKDFAIGFWQRIDGSAAR